MNRIALITFGLLTLCIVGCGTADKRIYDGPPKEHAGFAEMLEQGRYQLCSPWVDPTKTEGDKRRDAEEVEQHLRTGVLFIEDEEQYGTIEYWTVMSEDHMAGDCEDYALTARELLFARGWDETDMFILEGVRDTAEGKQEWHAVLIVWIDDLPYAIDNLSPGLHPPSNDFTWLIRTVYDKLEWFPGF